jgi:hypothetical protein
VVLRYADGAALGVVVNRDPTGALIADTPQELSPSQLEPAPPYSAPPTSLAQVPDPAPEVAARAALPFCGGEDAGLAGPFNAAARSCFLAAILNARSAEFLSKRRDVGGNSFTELWRFEGSGPIVIYVREGTTWKKLACALLLVSDSRQRFDHTDCIETALAL